MTWELEVRSAVWRRRVRNQALTAIWEVLRGPSGGLEDKVLKASSQDWDIAGDLWDFYRKTLAGESSLFFFSWLPIVCGIVNKMLWDSRNDYVRFWSTVFWFKKCEICLGTEIRFNSLGLAYFFFPLRNGIGFSNNCLEESSKETAFSFSAIATLNHLMDLLFLSWSIQHFTF